MESDSEGEDDDEIFRPSRGGNRASKRRRTSPESTNEFRENGDGEISEDGGC
jgi:DNA mismatch repair protein MSH6